VVALQDAALEAFLDEGSVPAGLANPTGKSQVSWTMRWKTVLNPFDITFDNPNNRRVATRLTPVRREWVNRSSLRVNGSISLGHNTWVFAKIPYERRMDDPFMFCVLSPALPNGARPHANQLEKPDGGEEWGEVRVGENFASGITQERAPQTGVPLPGARHTRLTVQCSRCAACSLGCIPC
jgi:hypothetical protein